MVWVLVIVENPVDMNSSLPARLEQIGEAFSTDFRINEDPCDAVMGGWSGLDLRERKEEALSRGSDFEGLASIVRFHRSDSHVLPRMVADVKRAGGNDRTRIMTA